MTAVSVTVWVGFLLHNFTTTTITTHTVFLAIFGPFGKKKLRMHIPVSFLDNNNNNNKKENDIFNAVVWLLSCPTYG